MENWQDLKPRERMMHLLNTGHLSDCSFVVFDEDGNKINLKCHKFILMYTSPVFERMFDGNFEESKKSDNIVLDDVSGSDFKKFIEYLYWHDNNKLQPFDVTTLQTLIYLSKKFMVNALTTNCLNVLKRRLLSGLDPDVTVDLYEYAHQIEATDIIQCITQKFISNPGEYIYTPAVYELSSEIFLKFISVFSYIVKESVRFSVIDRYCKIQGLAVDDKTESNETVNTAEEETPSVSDDQSEADAKPIEENECTKNDIENNVKKEEDIDDPEEIEEETDEEKANSLKKMEQKQAFVSELLKTVKFTSMTPYDFCAGPGKSNLLSDSMKFAFLSSICVAQHKMNLLKMHEM